LDVILFSVALLLWLCAGCGAVLLIMPRGRAVSVVEVLSLAVLFGAATISIATFCLGFGLSGFALRSAVTVVCLALGGAGWVRQRRNLVMIARPSRPGMTDYLFLSVLLIQTSLLVWLSLRATFGWDAIFNWEFKAHLACLNGGVIPLEYFSDTSRPGSHPEYPLFLPLIEGWFYGWLGSCHQGLVKLVFPPFYLAALGLLYVSGSRIGGTRLHGWLPAVMLFFVPIAIFRDGSVTSGYADFPLAVCYLAAAIYVAEYWETGVPDTLYLTASLGAVLPWVKQEGAVLWLIIAALVAVKAATRRQFRAVLGIVTPGLVIVLVWIAFLRVVKAPFLGAFLPLRPGTLWAHLDRWPLVLTATFREMADWTHWSLMWPGLLLTLPLMKSSERRAQVVVLLIGVIAPVISYSWAYVFSSYADFMEHVNTSLSRLLLHVAPVAVLILGLSIPRYRGGVRTNLKVDS